MQSITPRLPPARAVALALGALAGAAQAQAPAPSIEVKLSGHINRALLYADDGVEKEWFNVDNDNSSTRVRVNAEGTISPGLKAGALAEVEYQSNPTNLVTFATRQTPSPSFDERHIEVYLTGAWGMLRLGQGDGAANSASEVDLSGTSVAHYASTPDVGAAFQYRTAAGALSGASVGTTISNQGFESRYDRVLYKTPEFAGFTVEGSWGNKATDVVEAALRYSGKLGALGTLAGALGWSSEDTATPGGVDDEVIGGSISWLHTSGFNLTYAHTERDLPGRDGKFDYLKVGYKLGRHAVSVDYGQGKDQEAAGDDAKQYGIGYVFTPIAWAEIYALYKRHSLDRPGASLQDIDFAMIGTRVKF
jgi:hypothetical protein